jgi:ribosomal protein S18 acetylase RimI-like enzyme
MVNLRPLTEDDLPFLLEVRNNPSTLQFLENDSEFTLKQSLKWFRSNNPKWFIIEINRHTVGYIRTNEDEVGCDIHPDYRRKGYAKIAYTTYLKDKEYASLWVFGDNFARGLYEKLGFKYTQRSKIVRGRKYLEMEYYAAVGNS